MPNLRNGSKGGFEPGLTRLRVRHSTTELPRSIVMFEELSPLNNNHWTLVRISPHGLMHVHKNKPFDAAMILQ